MIEFSRDARITGASLALLLAWEATGLDFWLAALASRTPMALQHGTLAQRLSVTSLWTGLFAWVCQRKEAHAPAAG